MQFCSRPVHGAYDLQLPLDVTEHDLKEPSGQATLCCCMCSRDECTARHLCLAPADAQSGHPASQGSSLERTSADKQAHTDNPEDLSMD